MTNEVYEVKTNLNPEQLTELAAETYRIWLGFALGKTSIGGKTLAHPSGRYAAALSWRRTGIASIAIIADESTPEVGWIEYGRQGADIREAMLSGGNAKIGKDGYAYRVIPMRPDQWRATPSLGASDIVASGGGEKLRPGVAKIWATARPPVDGASEYVTMSANPDAHSKGADAWKVPPMPAYAPASILAELMGQTAASYRG